MKTKQKAVRRIPSVSNLDRADLSPDVAPICCTSKSPKRKHSLCEDSCVTTSSANCTNKKCIRMNILPYPESSKSIQDNEISTYAHSTHDPASSSMFSQSTILSNETPSHQTEMKNPFDLLVSRDISDKQGGSVNVSRRIEEYQEFMYASELIEIPFKGTNYTWDNKRNGGENVRERIDRALGNAALFEAFPYQSLTHQPLIGSDHSPLIYKTCSSPKKRRKSFKFESMWTLEESCEEVIRDLWCTSQLNDHMKNLKNQLASCAVGLRSWSRSHFGNNKKIVAKVSECDCLMRLIDQYCKASGQSINFSKSETQKWIPYPEDFYVRHPRGPFSPDTFVSDFINNGAWDISKLNDVVLPEEVSLISQIPISKSGAPDKLVWHYDAKGSYTVKSGYQQALVQRENHSDMIASTSSALNKSFWKQLWNLKTLPRVKFFWWKACSNALATHENLSRRGCNCSPICSICYSKVETVEHMLFECPWTNLVWFGSPLGLRLDATQGSIVSRVQTLLDTVHSKVERMKLHTSLANTAWQIWKSRNRKVFNACQPCPSNTISSVNSMLLCIFCEICCENYTVGDLVYKSLIMARNHGPQNNRSKTAIISEDITFTQNLVKVKKTDWVYFSKIL
ncbi:hypothetical protein CTI12_AA315900 [Artemisia annua]|uniref:Reverse transcriptase zinc-binding domain-containing protein n=1 Tax=Artemisia annua TaxID=35608 RepID=A0A2U1MVH6_ARTAN|nr:hypothetical protein CTI12_AA315900 [Artemisia annua]